MPGLMHLRVRTFLVLGAIKSSTPREMTCSVLIALSATAEWLRQSDFDTRSYLITLMELNGEYHRELREIEANLRIIEIHKIHIDTSVIGAMAKRVLMLLRGGIDAPYEMKEERICKINMSTLNQSFRAIVARLIRISDGSI